MSKKSRREWLFFVSDVIDSGRKILEITEGHSYEEFRSKFIVYHATIRLLEIIGEASNSIPREIQKRYPEIPWRLMVDTRNRLIHEYFGIDDEIIWDIVKHHIAEIIVLFENIQTNQKKSLEG